MKRSPSVRRLLLTVCGVLAAVLAAAIMLPAAGAQPSPNSAGVGGVAGTERALGQFHQTIEPLLKQYCYDCHGDGKAKGGLALDELTTKEKILHSPETWLKVLRNTRSRIMPPPDGPAPTADEQRALEQWIISGAFGLNPTQPDPGRVTVRRLNRTEYRNTLRDLIGVDFDVDHALPPDDVGYGFDNIGDVLSISPMRMEKFIEAAMAAVEQGVPQDTLAISSQMRLPNDFVSADGAVTGDKMTFYKVAKVTNRFHAKLAGEYRIHMAVKVDGDARPDPQKVRIRAIADDKEFFQQEYKWSDADYFDHERVIRLDAGEHEIGFTTEPVFPELQPLRSKMDFRILYVRVEGPLDRKQWEHPPGYKRFYSREAPPENPAERRAYAREVLGRFVPKAYRRPVSPETVERLVDLAEKNYSLPGVPFEKGIAQAMVAVLASPRFLFHLETVEPLAAGQTFPRFDDHTLASRLSYTLWSSMPDDELLQLAGRGELRKNFHAQVKRMLADPKGQAFAENFAGQWLQSRGVMDIQINSVDIMAREGFKQPTSPSPDGVPPAIPAAPAAPSADAAAAPAAPLPTAVPAEVVAAANLPATPPAPGAPARTPNPAGARRPRGPTTVPGTILTAEIRKAMKQEAEAYLNHIVREDRSVLELIDSNYTFVNEQLAPVYGLTNVTGPEMRKVTLPDGDLRGGVLTMGSVLTVTSNPTRTSPVKRGKWILENILGAPPAPPPPNIPSLEDSQEKVVGKRLTQRDLLAMHRADPMCASCHSRMDPLGLAMENFNGFGRARTQEYGDPIDPAGELATGEKFGDVRELKRTLVEKHHLEFYRTLTEKLLTYSLGRGLEYYDVPTVDAIVARLDQQGGRFSELLFGVLESAPFQHRRPTPHAPNVGAKPAATLSLNPVPAP